MTTANPAPVPPPGSDAAIRAGCTCPVLDNAHGAGIGGGLWWIDSECPLHGADGYWQLDAELSDMHMRPRAGGEARPMAKDLTLEIRIGRITYLRLRLFVALMRLAVWVGGFGGVEILDPDGRRC